MICERALVVVVLVFLCSSWQRRVEAVDGEEGWTVSIDAMVLLMSVLASYLYLYVVSVS